MSAEKFRVVIYTNTCEKKVSYIPAYYREGDR